MRNEVNGAVQNAVQVGTVEGDLNVLSPAVLPPVPSVQPPFGRVDTPVRGRDALLDELGALLFRPGPKRVAVLHGLGGTGKTTIALALAQRAAAEGITVLWVSAANQTDLHAGMRQVAVSLGASAQQIEQAWSGRANATDLVWRILDAHLGRWLLILDNADDPEAFGGVEVVRDGTGWWREVRSERGAVLATSRNGAKSGWGSWCTLFRVDGLSAVDGALILLDLAGEEAGGREEAESLALHLGGLPLALRLAGRYLAEACAVPWSVDVRTYADYARALRSGLAGGELMRTWDLSLELLERRGCGEARKLLERLCHYGPSPIPVRSLLSPVVAGVGALELWRSLTELANTGLIDLVDEAGPWVHIHPLVREMGRTRARDDGTTELRIGFCARSITAAVAEESLESPEEPDRWRFWEAVVPHARWLVQAAALPLPQAVVRDIAAAAVASARHLRALGLYQRSADELTDVVSLCKARLGESDHHTLDARHCRASALHAVGRYEIALAEYREVLELRTGALNEDDVAALPTRHQMASALHDLGRLEDAEREFRALLTVRRRVSGPADARTLTTWLRWARVIEDRGDLAAAVREYTSIAAVQADQLGPRHRHTLTTRHQLAAALLVLGDLDGAEAGTRFVLETRREVLGDEHPTTLITLSQMALVHHRRGRLAEAVRDYSTVLELQVRKLGSGHPSTTITRQRLDEALAAQSPG